MKNKYIYTVDEPLKGRECVQSFDLESEWTANDEMRMSWILEEAAKDLFLHHDGWEAKWPLVIYLYDENAKLICKSEVKMETVPNFIVYESDIEVSDD